MTSVSRAATFLADVGLGFTGLALGAMLHRDGVRPPSAKWSPPDGKPHFAPKAKSVIWVFLSGGVSQLESFDPKPALTKYAGKTFADTPYPDPLKSPLFVKHSRDVVGGTRPYPKIFPLQVGFKKHGKLGVEISRLVAAPRRRASTTSPSSGRCTRPTTTTAPSSRCTPAGTSSTSSSR